MILFEECFMLSKQVLSCWKGLEVLRRAALCAQRSLHCKECKGCIVKNQRILCITKVPSCSS